MLLPLQGVNTMAIRNTQGVASLALGYGSAIEVNFIAQLI